MKLVALFKLFLLSTLFFMAGCGYNEIDNYRPSDPSIVVPNTQIETILTQYQGVPATVNANYIIQGRVTTSDQQGNFYRSFIIQDGSGAIEVMAGLYDLHNIYFVGQRVVIRTEGLRVGSRDGVVQIGLKPTSGVYGETEYFNNRAILAKYLTAYSDIQPVEPHETTIPALTQNLCGELVCVNNIVFTPIDSESQTWGIRSGWNDKPQTAYREFQDAGGNKITLVCSGYADFADIPIPTSTLSVTGILMYGKGLTAEKGYMLKINSLDDVRPL